MQRIFILLVATLIFSSSVSAESRYVTDQILVALRPAQNDTAPPLEYLPTGMRVDLVEDLGAFLKLRSETGKIGFARSKYFLPTPPEGATAKTSALQEKLTAAMGQVEELRNEIHNLKSTQESAPSTAPPAAAADEENKSRGEIATLRLERDQLKQEVARLKEVDKQGATSPARPELSQLQWFLAGAAILFLGWLAGKSSRPKRRF